MSRHPLGTGASARTDAMTVRRFAAFALLGIVLPAAILAVLGYHSLRQWEASANLLFREQAREMASMAAEKVEALLRRTEDAILGRIQALVTAPRLDAGGLQALPPEIPLVRRLYLIDGQGRPLFPTAPEAEDAPTLAALTAETAQGFWALGGRRRLVIGGTLIVAAVLDAQGRPVYARGPLRHAGAWHRVRANPWIFRWLPRSCNAARRPPGAWHRFGGIYSISLKSCGIHGVLRHHPGAWHR